MVSCQRQTISCTEDVAAERAWQAVECKVKQCSGQAISILPSQQTALLDDILDMLQLEHKRDQQLMVAGYAATALQPVGDRSGSVTLAVTARVDYAINHSADR